MKNSEERTVEIIVNGQKANASIKEMEASVAVLNAQWRKMSQDDPGRGKIIEDLNAMKARVTALKSEVGGVSQTTGVMKQAFANAFAIFTGGGILGVVQQIFGFLSSSREEFLQSAKSGADLAATLKSTAHAAGLTAEQIQKIGTERAKVTLFDDDETNRASAMLLTFTNIKKGVFEQAIPAIQDLATKMGGDGPADLKGASIQVGKALNDPTNGLKALTRVGVTFTEQQKDQIKAMQKAGDTAGAQRLILNELNKEFGGSAEAARKAGGGVATLTMWFNEFKETVGSKVNQVLNDLSQWFGRVLEKADPLVAMVTELVDQFAAYYREIGDVLEGMGLFTEKTDSAGIVIEVLKGALTLLLIPLRTMLQISRAVVDGFIEWYNKSEMLRGVLGGLGAVIVTLFTTIKDDAIKILGGVGDILIGIFTLDKNKIAAGFKSALSATADLALEAGNKAADAFAKGYEANKNNKIVRKQAAPDAPEEKTYDWDKFKMDDKPAGESDKEKKSREAATKKRLAELKKQHKDEEAAERTHQEMMLNLAEEAIVKQGQKRKAELAAIEFDAMRKSLAVTGSVQAREAAIALIEAEAQQKRTDLQAKFDKEDADAKEKAAKEKAEKAQELEDAYQEVALAQLDLDHANGLISEQEYQDKLYQITRDGLQKKLDLLIAAGQGESAEALKIKAALNTANVNHVTKIKGIESEKTKVIQDGLKAASGVLGGTIDLLFQDEQARKEHHDAYMAMAASKIIVDGLQEVSGIWMHATELGPIAGPIVGALQTALAIGRTMVALDKLGETSPAGFAKGGATGGGMKGMPGYSMNEMFGMPGAFVGSNGKLMDNSGFAVAGIVHEDEYVVPKWMRQDPQVAAVEQWLEAKRLRGYAEGGATGGATLPAANPAPASDGELTYAVLVQILQQAQQQTQQLADVKDWQTKISVHLNLVDLDKGQKELKQVQLENGIR